MENAGEAEKRNKFNKFFDALYHYFITPYKQTSRGIDRIYIAILIILGLVLWGYLLDWGKGPLYYHDWASITEPRLAFLQNALNSFHLPLESTHKLDYGEDLTTHFLAIPDIVLSPQVFLLWFMNINLFSLVQVWLMYLLGFWGLLKLRAKFSYSPLTFLIVFLLYNFNGHLIAHISVGHLSFAACFLLSWFVYLIFEFIEEKGNWKWIAKMAFLLFFIILNGGYHHLIYCLFCLVILAVFYPKHFRFMITTILLVVGVSLFRILPEIALVKSSTSHFIAGFFDLQTFLDSFIQIQHPAVTTTYDNMTLSLNLHEVTFYIGVAGAIFLFYFGLYKHLVDKELDKRYRWLMLPMAVLFLLSLDQVYRNIIVKIPLPFFYAERVSTRIFIIVFDVLIFLAANQFQKWLNNPKTAKVAIVTAMILVVYGMHDLWQNLSCWTVNVASSLFSPSSFSANEFVVNNSNTSPLYFLLVFLGLAGTVIFSVFIGWQVWRENRMERVRKIHI